MEAIAEILGDEWTKMGMEVTIVTRIPCEIKGESRKFDYPIIRNPSRSEFLRLVREADVFMQNGISLKGLWPLLLERRPYVVKHGIWYGVQNDPFGFLKKWVSRYAVNIAVSQAVADSLPGKSTIIHNPYNNQIFRQYDGIERSKDLVFVGRLVSDKGIDLLIEALVLLKAQGIHPFLTVIGEGPERPGLEQYVAETGLNEQVRFVGRKAPAQIAPMLCAHKILVVPSRWNEPFGIVALEGIACGCAIVGSCGGGLAEAIGRCGLTFANGDIAELAEKIKILLADSAMREAMAAHAADHLSSLQPAKVATRYLEVIQQHRRSNKC